MENVFDEMTITTEENERWKVTNLKTADYCFETLKSIEDKKAELKAFAEEKIQKVQQWLENELKPLEASEEHYKSLITEYYIKQKKLNNKFKLSTPSGKITQRTTKTLNYDEDTILNYLESSHNDLIQIVNKYFKSDVKNIIKANNGIIIDSETGKILSFVTEEEKTTYSVETNIKEIENMCKFQAVRIASEKLRELGYMYIDHSLKNGELTLLYENIIYGTVDKMIISYRYFTSERLRVKIIIEVMK